ncbi:MAG: LysE family translocator [Gammaproteobacteria bacterium]|nr:LysE family translocator [Gammaproteobacteria bacterium]MBV9698106.1 LysE family translocator [Gammaproteobacteria bacterium]
MIDPLPFLTYTFVMSITPGPNNVMLTASGARFGLRRTLPHLIGISSGFAVQLLAVCAGLAVLFRRWPALQTLLSWVGAAYLVFLGWQLLRSEAAAAAARARPLRLYEAALFQFLNPKAWVMSLTAATLFLPAGLDPLLQGLYMVAVNVAIGLPCMTVWALFGSSLRSFLAGARARMLFNTSMAVALAATAVLMVR